MKEKNITLSIDLIFCVIILPLVITMVPVEKWIEKYTLFAVSLVAYMYVLYFAIRKVNFPQLFMNRRYGRMAVFILLFLGTTYLLSLFPYPESAADNSALHPHLKEHLRSQTVWFLFLVVSGFSLSVSLIFELFRQTLAKKELESQKNKAELALYKAQIDPHFLFNTLNTLYGLVIQKCEKAESAFAQFADMVQYMYTHAKDDTVAVRDEIDYIGHYIDLQSLRLNSHTKVVWECETDDDTLRIPPMLLVTFVENAFKYGASSSKDCTIRIRMEIEEGVLRFTTQNGIMKKRHEKEPAVGIENCRARLGLLYPGRFTLTAREENSEYELNLTIRLK